MTLGIKYNDQVEGENFDKDKPGQTWKRGESNNEGYFTLNNSESAKVMTAVSENKIKLKGKFVVVEKLIQPIHYTQTCADFMIVSQMIGKGSMIFQRN